MIGRHGLLALAMLAPTAAAAQYGGATQYVCQTPAFWCGFVLPGGPTYPNGTPCHCNQMGYQVGGRIVASSAWGQQQAPYPTPTTNPAPQDPYPPIPTPPTPVPPPTPTTSADDCFRGLGNCSGAFSSVR